ncbi:LLM class flavin-dependent oxidoreductase [Variovorax sp. KBW07]|uniref:TIGR03571 family LLM class oxidoreductase n=1 Tax=Variovorax sp. KBW07 TaxID=2153358 RepID=UPI000F58EF12|nr:TIGR03571 family LLM class oxidoreductase [Variovorax sp. KBW07]RQO46799.1 LLM class flavin-dependent oxidoreductase [Variovorax sp. KBW07]
MTTALERLLAGGFSIGLELPLDNDWCASSEAARQGTGRLRGEPDIAQHAALAQLADRQGFRALWVRDVPLYDPKFGDAAQVFEVFTYLGFLAGATRNILLGTAAVVLPLREPVLTMKAAATADQLSNGRLLLGVASGDRPVEYPVFGRAFDTRGDAFRSQVEMLRHWTSHDWDEGLQVLPRPTRPLSLLVAGLGQQSLEWVGAHMDGLLAYPRTPQEHLPRTQAWHAAAGPGKPYASFMHIDLLAKPDAPITRHHFGVMTGRRGLIAELEAMRDAGVRHMGLHLRRCQRPVAEVLEEIGSHVLPVFHGH